MALLEQINSDLKQALLAGDKELVSVLRGLKSAILYEEVAQNKRDDGLEEQQVTTILQKEAKKRLESAELYDKGGSPERAAKERAEQEIIKAYLPQMMSDEEVEALVSTVIADHPEVDKTKMGIVIGEVKKRSEGRADGATIARLVKERL